MSLADEFTASTDQELIQRVQMAAVSAAQAIASEAESTPNHNNRVALANKVANAPGSYGAPFTTLLCAEGITSASTDADINNMVSATWNTMAGQPVS